VSQIEATSPFAPDFEFINSSMFRDCSCQSAFSVNIKPDICVYMKKSACRGLTDIACAELVIEFKWHTHDDPFTFPTLIDEGENKILSFLCDSKAGVDTTGQITTYAAAQLGSQFRTCVYSVLIIQSYARLIRWDRTGAIISEPIDFNQQPHLVEFFRRYFKASPKLRGVDTTVGVPTADKALAARNCLQLDKDIILAKIAVPSPTSKWQYVIRAPKGEPYTPPGCATCSFEAYNIERGRKVFVKDMWRVDLPGIEKEGETYKLLWDAQVRNIAVCSAAGDIHNHATRTHHYQDRPWACKTRSRLVPLSTGVGHGRAVADEFPINTHNAM
jgi:hypothetical protein